MEGQHTQRGGRRAGAGRKKKDGVGTEFVGVKLNRNHYRLIKDNHDNLSAFVGEAVREKLEGEGLL